MGASSHPKSRLPRGALSSALNALVDCQEAASDRSHRADQSNSFACEVSWFVVSPESTNQAACCHSCRAASMSAVCTRATLSQPRLCLNPWPSSSPASCDASAGSRRSVCPGR